ncbi:ABC transporter permease [Aureispira anguillae]|uniref:ABC transporter permease n=1 Tax=Aureispira anguillae TaxID=2864201 RepID=A0A915YF92_9BACT|nr:FtsX-like permease family protein [Aureispira anguillae]BDS12038.1 ABC transporter permease [Aureispira anguillae]
MNLLKLSWKYLAAKPFATLLSTILVALGVSLTSILFLLNKQFQDRLYKNIDEIDLVVSAKGSPLQMILSSVYHIDAPTGNIPLKESYVVTKNPYVEKAIPLALGDSYDGFRIVGTDHQYIEHFGAEIETGRLIEQDLEVVIGARAAKKLGLKLGATFYGSHGLVKDGGHVHETYAYEVVGILKETNLVLDQLILTNVSTVWRMHEDHDHGAEGHNHDSDAHDHGDHDHTAHDHGEDKHAAHDHGDHDHAAHDHGEDKHAAHDHGDHDHAAHDHGEHKHDAHDHGDHDHAAHDHGEHDHAAHDHGEHKHDGHDHAGHNHDGHDHAGHVHKKTKALPPISKEGKEVTAYLVQYKKDSDGNTSMRATVEAPMLIDDNSEDFGYAKPAIELQRLLEMTGVGMDFLSALAFIIILISAFSMFISLYSSLKERRYEMALMRVMGASPAKLFIMIIMEGILVAIAGLLLGMIISHLGMEIMASHLEETYKYTFSGWIFLKEEFFLTLGALLIGFFAAIIPAIQAYRVDISETLSNA